MSILLFALITLSFRDPQGTIFVGATCDLTLPMSSKLRFQFLFLRRHYPDQVLGYDLSLFVDVALDNLFRHPLIEICCEGSANFAACKIKVNEINGIDIKSFG